MQITDEMIVALNELREFAKVPSVFHSLRRAQYAFNVLDNADFFTAIDDAANERETLAQFAAGSVDPAEWGDTTSADMAAHQREI